MKIMIEIPEEFICDYEADRFEDCFRRLVYDSGFFAGRYEKETTEMLIKAFRDAKEVIMCKGCRYFEEPRNGWERCTRAMDILIHGADFCSFGERKEE